MFVAIFATDDSVLLLFNLHLAVGGHISYGIHRKHSSLE